MQFLFKYRVDTAELNCWGWIRLPYQKTLVDQDRNNLKNLNVDFCKINVKICILGVPTLQNTCFNIYGDMPFCWLNYVT